MKTEVIDMVEAIEIQQQDILQNEGFFAVPVASINSEPTILSESTESGRIPTLLSTDEIDQELIEFLEYSVSVMKMNGEITELNKLKVAFIWLFTGNVQTVSKEIDHSLRFEETLKEKASLTNIMLAFFKDPNIHLKELARYISTRKTLKQREIDSLAATVLAFFKDPDINLFDKLSIFTKHASTEHADFVKNFMDRRDKHNGTRTTETARAVPIQQDAFQYEITDSDTLTEINEVVAKLQVGGLPKLFLMNSSIGEERLLDIIRYYASINPDVSQDEVSSTLAKRLPADKKIEILFDNTNRFYEFIFKNPLPLIQYLQKVLTPDIWELAKIWLTPDRQISLPKTDYGKTVVTSLSQLVGVSWSNSGDVTGGIFTNLEAEHKLDQFSPDFVRRIIKSFYTGVTVPQKLVNIDGIIFYFDINWVIEYAPHLEIGKSKKTPEQREEIKQQINYAIEETHKYMSKKIYLELELEKLSPEEILVSLQQLIPLDEQQNSVSKFLSYKSTAQKELLKDKKFEDLINKLTTTKPGSLPNYSPLADFLEKNLLLERWNEIIEFFVPANILDTLSSQKVEVIEG